jgi:glycosyltransferase involved in cell wall biosynthesis
VRILQVIPTLAAGGLERVATNLTVGLAETGDTVVVCTAGLNVLQVNEDALRAAHIPIERMRRPARKPGALVRSGLAIARTIRSSRPEVVHAHNPAAALAAAFARVAAGRPRLPIVTTFHGLAQGDTASAVRVLRLTSDLVVAIGPATAADLVDAGLAPDRLVTVLNGMAVTPTRPREDTRHELGVAADAELIVTVGRYSAEKNQRQLLEAIALLTPSRPRLRALLVGIGPSEPELRRHIARLRLEDVATLTGLRDDPLDIATAADVATLTSLREGLGLSLIEAMLVGTPVIGNRVGGIPDVISDGETGLLVEPGDAKALAAALERLLDDPALRESLATAARRDAETRFSIAAMVEGYRAAYARALRR